MLAEATEQLAKKQLDAAASTLRKLVQEKPDSIEAYRMLQNICWRQNDVPGYRDSVEKLIELELKANNFQEAWEAYQDFKRSGAEKLSARVWLDLCRQAETIRTHNSPSTSTVNWRKLTRQKSKRCSPRLPRRESI